MIQPVATRLAEGVSSGIYDPSVDPAGLGVRAVGSHAASGELLDVLRVTADLGRPPTVEMALRERATRFAPARLAGLAPIVRIERGADGRLEVWSRRVEGFRLSAVLEWTEARGVATPLEAALTVGDRLLAALASLQEADDATGPSGHGAIAVDQVVVSESGALTLTDYAFGTALSALQWPRERLWRRFRIAMPPAAGLARFDHRVDVTQAAVVICALLAGRLLGPEEYPRDIQSIVSDTVRRAGADAGRDDHDRLLTWLRAATEMEPRNAFRSAAAAREALNAVLGHRIGDDEAVRRWLRDARGLPAEAPEPRQAPAPAPALSVDVPVTRQSLWSRLRAWIGIG
ncbi:MAG: hypothetical protein M3Q55_10920 [Acidobacteriota bacterium]|nr:hypothetical protein [Acidobacteriota bacterium]